MTPLRTPISRKTPIQMDNRRELRDRDQIVVTLYPGGIIGFRFLTLPGNCCQTRCQRTRPRCSFQHLVAGNSQT